MREHNIKISISDENLRKLALSKDGAKISLNGEVIGCILPPSIEFKGAVGGVGALEIIK